MSRAVNVSIVLKDGENQEKLIKRFFKICKKQGILEEHLEKVSHARSKSQKRRDKIRKNAFQNKRNAAKKRR